MVLLPLHQSCCITQAVGLLEDCHIPQQLAIGNEDGIQNLGTSESSEGNGVGGVWGGAKTPLVLEGLTRVGRLEACEVEGDLAGVGPESWHSHPEMHKWLLGSISTCVSFKGRLGNVAFGLWLPASWHLR